MTVHLVRRSLLTLLAGLGALMAPSLQARTVPCLTRPRLSWAVFYGEDVDPEALRGFDLVILDSSFKGEIAALAERGTQVLGYLSLGEIKRSSEWFASIDDESLLLSENPNWPGTFLCDVRHPQWRRLIVEIAVPALRRRGFTGLFFDTLDTPPHLETLDPVRHTRMRHAAIALVRDIRRLFPEMILVANRGYALLPELGQEIDAIVAESFLTSYDFVTKEYKWVPKTEVGYHAGALKKVDTSSAWLPILSLDYWNSEDPVTIREIYARERALGHRPYVAGVLLDQIVPEPLDP